MFAAIACSIATIAIVGGTHLGPDLVSKDYVAYDAYPFVIRGQTYERSQVGFRYIRFRYANETVEDQG